MNVDSVVSNYTLNTSYYDTFYEQNQGPYNTAG